MEKEGRRVYIYICLCMCVCVSHTCRDTYVRRTPSGTTVRKTEETKRVRTKKLAR